jgi:hypothetical protein
LRSWSNEDLPRSNTTDAMSLSPPRVFNPKEARKQKKVHIGQKPGNRKEPLARSFEPGSGKLAAAR